MKYLKYFEQASAYEAYKNGSDFITPNVSYVKETKDISYEPKIEKPTQVYLVSGDEVGIGSDNEPLLKNIKVLDNITEQFRV
jgi:hypothetical protein